jgi:hypothetical protein
MSAKKAKIEEANKDDDAGLMEPDKQKTPLGTLAIRYLELRPSENNVLAAAAMAPRLSNFEPHKLLTLVDEIWGAEEKRVSDKRRSLAEDMELDELEALLFHLGCFETSHGYPPNDPVWQNDHIAPALFVYQESRLADDNPVKIDMDLRHQILLEKHERQYGLTRPNFPSALDDALRYCCGDNDHPVAPLRQAFKDLQSYSEWQVSNANNRRGSSAKKRPFGKKNAPVPTTFLSSTWMTKFSKNPIGILEEAELSALLWHFGNFWKTEKSHYLAADDVRKEANSRRVAVLKKVGNTGVNTRERNRWLKLTRAFVKEHGAIIQEGDDSKFISTLDAFIIKFRSKNNGAPDGDLIKALFRTILGVKGDVNVTPSIKQRAIESLGKRGSAPYKSLTDEAIREIADVLLTKPRAKRVTKTSRKHTLKGTKKTS